jgi:S1-C subfamily serine protease
MRRRSGAGVAVILAAIAGTPLALARPDTSPPSSARTEAPALGDSRSKSLWTEFIGRASEVLKDRQLTYVTEANPMGAGPNRRATYQQLALAVPLVIAQDGMGSSAAIRVDSDRATAWIITNQHVVEHPFRRDGRDYVYLVFYSAALIGPPLTHEQIVRCASNPEVTKFCHTLHLSFRDAAVQHTDKRRDLALLRVDHPPKGLKAIRQSELESVQMGDGVTFLGHPQGYLWSLSAGTVSQVRPGFSLSEDESGITIVQTDTAINPGSSGGPLLATDMKLIGIAEGGALLNGTGIIEVPASGLNFAIAVNEVQNFLTESNLGKAK